MILSFYSAHYTERIGFNRGCQRQDTRGRVNIIGAIEGLNVYLRLNTLEESEGQSKDGEIMEKSRWEGSFVKRNGRASSQVLAS